MLSDIGKVIAGTPGQYVGFRDPQGWKAGQGKKAAADGGVLECDVSATEIAVISEAALQAAVHENVEHVLYISHRCLAFGVKKETLTTEMLNRKFPVPSLARSSHRGGRT